MGADDYRHIQGVENPAELYRYSKEFRATTWFSQRPYKLFNHFYYFLYFLIFLIYYFLVLFFYFMLIFYIAV